MSINIPKIKLEKLEIPNTSAQKFTADMKIGWNLGNTLDATAGQRVYDDELLIEAGWCGILTTKEMIQMLKPAGFNTLRLPVSWHDHVNEDFVISKKWLDRVQELVDYAMNEGLYVILNIHHDDNKKYYYPLRECLSVSERYMKSIWKQISERFRDYSEKLVFESINEPRLAGMTDEWLFDIKKENFREATECINVLNQICVDVVRSSGGNNENRYIMVPGYAASVDGAVCDEFRLPKDSCDNKIIVSAHTYSPYNFALQPPTEEGSVSVFDLNSAASTKDIDSFMKKLYDKYIANGYAVVVGEFGSRNKNDNLQSRVDCTAYFVSAAKKCGITCVWWDNHSFDGKGENFGIMDRQNLTWKFPEIVEALMIEH